MFRFIVRRVAFITLVCLSIIFFTYLGMGMLRNSEDAQPNYDMVQHTQRAWRNTKGYIYNLFEGNISFGALQGGIIGSREGREQVFRNSLGLLVIALGGATIIGLWIGTLSALAKNKSVVLPLLMLTLLGMSVPSFFAGLLLQTGEIYYLRVFGRRLVSVAGFGWDFEHMLLPVLVLMARPLAYLTRASFLAVDNIMREDFIRTAYAKGLSQRHTVYVHATRNVAVPILTAIGVSLRFSLSSLPIVEFFFRWPGIGFRMLEAIEFRQSAMVVTMAAALGLTFLTINLFLDIIYRLVDPRLREEI